MKKPHTWCDIHEIPKSFEEQADELADVFTIVSKREEERIATISRNLKGKFIMTKEAPHTIDAQLEKVVHTRNIYGDPVDICEKHLSLISPDYFARMTNSLSWYMQMSTINAARSVLFALYDEAKEALPLGETPEGHFESFCLDIHDVLKRDSVWELNDECIEAAEKYLLMEQWLEAAQSAAHANDRDFIPKELGELLVTEKPATVRLDTKANYEMLAKHRAKKTAKSEAELVLKTQAFVNELIRRDKLQAQDRVDRNKKLIAPTEVILDHIKMHKPDRVIFTSMNDKFMRSAIDFTVNTLQRVLEQDIAKDRGMSAQKYMDIIDAQDACIEELEQFKEMHASIAKEVEGVSYAGDPIEKHNRMQADRAGRTTPKQPANTQVPAQH